MAYNVLLQYVLPYNYIILLLHCHNLKICLRIYWPSKMCIDHYLVLELACGVVTPLCYHNKLLTTKLQVIISSSLLSFSLCSPSTLWAWSRACLLLSYTLTRWTGMLAHLYKTKQHQQPLPASLIWNTHLLLLFRAVLIQETQVSDKGFHQQQTKIKMITPRLLPFKLHPRHHE